MILGLMLAIVATGCKKGGEENKEAQSEASAKQETAENQQEMKKENIYQFKVNDLYGSEFDFSTLKGKKVMVVNTASECGLTPQYADLQKLYDKYKEQDFVIVGFPANNFGGQEPGSDAEIATFCKENYGVRLEKIDSWAVQYIAFQNQKDYAIYAYSTDDFRLQHCTVNVPRYYAYYQYRSQEVTIEDNVLVRDENSGSGFFIYYCSGSATVFWKTIRPRYF